MDRQDEASDFAQSYNPEIQINKKKVENKTELNHFLPPTESTTKTGLINIMNNPENKLREILSPEGNFTNSPIVLNITKDEINKSKNDKNLPDSKKFLQKKRKNTTLEKNNSNKKAKTAIFATQKYSSKQNKEQNQVNKSGLKEVNVNNKKNASNNIVISCTIFVNEAKLVSKTQEYLNNTLYYDPTEYKRNFKRIEDLNFIK
jgi:hypothetical protein